MNAPPGYKPAHKLSQYNDAGVWIVFCTRCSAEGDALTVPCPGKYVEQKKPPHKSVERNFNSSDGDKIVDKVAEPD